MFSETCPNYCIGHDYTKKLFVMNLKFKFTGHPIFLFSKSDNPTTRRLWETKAISWENVNEIMKHNTQYSISIRVSIPLPLIGKSQVVNTHKNSLLFREMLSFLEL